MDWCRSRVSVADLYFVRGFHRTWALPLEGETSLFLFHGSARSNMGDLLATTPPELVDEMLAGRRAAVLAGSHTNVQMLRQHRGMLIVNPAVSGCHFVSTRTAGRPPCCPTPSMRSSKLPAPA